MIKENESLVIAARAAATGANIHSVNTKLAKYRWSVHLHNNMEKSDPVKAEQYRVKAIQHEMELKIYLGQLAQEKQA